MFDAVKTGDGCVLWIRSFYEVSRSRRAVVPYSDSPVCAVSAALCAEALGRDNVTLAELSGDGKGALLSSRLRIKRALVDLDSAYDALSAALASGLDGERGRDARKRLEMTALYALAGDSDGRVVNALCLNDIHIGAYTRFGDSAGDLSPCGLMTLREVRAVGRALGLPPELVETRRTFSVPGAGGGTFSYDELDAFLRNGAVDPAASAAIKRLHKAAGPRTEDIPTFDPGAHQIKNAE